MAKKRTGGESAAARALPLTADRKYEIAAALLAAIAAFALFAPTLGYDFVLWDDNKLVSENPAMRPLDLPFIRYAFTNVGISVWYPLTLISLSLDHTLFGGKPFGFHLTNVLLHAANAFLFTLLSIRLLQWDGRESEKATEGRALLLGALFSGLLFALHPLRVESVAWVTERKDVLSGFFIFLTLLAYLRYAASPPEARKRLYVATLLFFIPALLSKPIAVMVPVILLVLDFYPLKRLGKGNLYGAVLEKAPFFALSLCVGIITILTGSGGEGAATPITPALRLYHACYAFLFYPVKMLIPLDLAPFYPIPETAPFSAAWFAVILLFLALTTAIVALGKRLPALAAVWGSYIIFLLPVVGFVKYSDFIVANRYAYLSLLGFCLLLGHGAARMAELAGRSGKFPLAASVGFLIVCLYASASLREMPAWRDSIALWSREIDIYPKVALAYNNRGIAWFRNGENGRALEDYKKAISLDPRFFRPHYNLGKLYQKTARTGEAIESYTQSIALNPGYADAYNNRGIVLKEKGDAEAARRDFDRAIELSPRYAGAYNNRANALKALGETKAAFEDYEKAILFDPEYAEAWYNRANLLADQGRDEEAARDYARTMRLAPHLWQPFFNRGNLYLRRGDYLAAAEDYRQAIARRSTNPAVYHALAIACGKTGDVRCEEESMKQAAAAGYRPAAEALKGTDGR